MPYCGNWLLDMGSTPSADLHQFLEARFLLLVTPNLRKLLAQCVDDDICHASPGQSGQFGRQFLRFRALHV